MDRLEKQSWHRDGVDREFQEMLHHSTGIGEVTIGGQGVDLARIAEEYGATAVIAGHTHAWWSNVTCELAVWTVPSSGMPIDGDWRPGWALVEVSASDRPRVRARRVEYDVEAWLEQVRARRDHPSVETQRKLADYSSIFVRGRLPHMKD